MTDFLEPKIEPLVEALSSYRGIETFSSCDEQCFESDPHVSFRCRDTDALKAITQKLSGTSWKIVIEDWPSGGTGNILYTLRYVPFGLFRGMTLETIYDDIKHISKLLKKRAVNV